MRRPTNLASTSRRLCGLGVALAALALAPPAAHAATTGLVVSTSATRSNPQPLAAATLKGSAYIFVAGYAQTARVRFALDGGATVTRSAPFDYAGSRSTRTANPLDTTQLADGPHTLTASVQRSGGAQIASLSATFTVANVAPPPPLPPPHPPPPPAGRSLLVPAYFAPGAAWTRMCATLPAGALAIMNPDSGPGTSTDAGYTSAVSACHARGIGVLGYVYTSYGARSLSAVHADVDAYFARYPVDGIFFDEASEDLGTQMYYAGLYQYVHAERASGLTVVTNPGDAAPSAWQLDGGTADIVNVFEGTQSSFAAWTPPAWIAQRPASRLSSMVYATAAQSAMQSACAQAAARNLGWTYVTPDGGSNPWDTLPADPYWTAELTACG